MSFDEDPDEDATADREPTAGDDSHAGDDPVRSRTDSPTGGSFDQPPGDETDGTQSGVTSTEPTGQREDSNSQEAVHTTEAPVDDESPSLAGILGAEQPEESDGPPRPTIEPETPSLENAVFVVLGVVGSLLVVYRLVTLF